MKKLIIILTFLSLTFLTTSKAYAYCNIRPSAISDLHDLYKYTHGELSRPKLKIDNGKLTASEGIQTQLYGVESTKKYYLGAYTQNDKITVYSRIFKLHKKCDEHVKSKLRGMLAHEYTHYLDNYGVLSNLIHASDIEQTAIISEYVLSKLAWGNLNVQYTRPLTLAEQGKATILKSFFIQNNEQ